MRLLFAMDTGDYARCTHTFLRHSARSIILRGGKLAMIHSLKYDYYKFPGGGIKAGESPIDAMIRETREEAGLLILPETIREYGFVHRIQKSTRDETEIFLQDNYYYLCQAEETPAPQHLDAYEAEEGFRLEYTEALTAMEKNRLAATSAQDPLMLEREARVLELLIKEGILDKPQAH